MNKPDILTNKEDIDLWVDYIESYLETIDKKHWFKLAKSFIDKKLFKEIHLDKINEEDKYLALKKQLLQLQEDHKEAETKKKLEDQKKIDEQKSIEAQKIANQRKKINYTAIRNKKQNNNESIEEYGHNLIKTVTTMFPNVDLEALDEYLKAQFADGLQNQQLSQKMKCKINKQQRKNETFNIKDAIEYGMDKNEQFKLENHGETGENLDENQMDTHTSENNESTTHGSIYAIQMDDYNNNNMNQDRQQIRVNTPRNNTNGNKWKQCNTKETLQQL